MEHMPSEGIWLVKHKPGVKSSSHILKISELPDKWPLLHYAQYEDDILKAVLKKIDEKQPRGISLQEIVRTALEEISKLYAKDKEENFPNKLVQTILDLNE